MQLRQAREQQWRKVSCSSSCPFSAHLHSQLTSLVTAPDVGVASGEELLEQCADNAYLTAVAKMFITTTTPTVPTHNKQALLEVWQSLSHSTHSYSSLQEACAHLQPLAHKQKHSSTSSSGNLIPPPVLVHCSPSMMLFSAPHFTPPPGSPPLTYFTLYGRPASGSNVQVRVTDKRLEGLGVAMGGASLLRVAGLQPNTEYVFAVTAHGPLGELIGGGMGASTRPLLASHSFPLSTAWGLLCQVSE